MRKEYVARGPLRKAAATQKEQRPQRPKEQGRPPRLALKKEKKNSLVEPQIRRGWGGRGSLALRRGWRDRGRWWWREWRRLGGEWELVSRRDRWKRRRQREGRLGSGSHRSPIGGDRRICRAPASSLRRENGRRLKNSPKFRAGFFYSHCRSAIRE